MLLNHGRISPVEMFVLMAAAVAVGLIVQAISIVRSLRACMTTARYETKRWMASGLRFWTSSILGLQTSTRRDPDLLDAGFGHRELFAASRRNIFAMPPPPCILSRRDVFRCCFNKKHQEFEHTLILMAEVTALCVLSGLVIIWIGAPYLLSLFGPAFVEQKWTLIVLAFGTAFQAAGGPAAAIIQLTGRESSYVPVVAANVALRLLGFFILIPWLGVLGAAASATLSLALTTIALNFICRRWTGVDPSILVLFRPSRWKAKPRPAAAADPNV